MSEFKYWRKPIQKPMFSEEIHENIVQIPADSIRPNRSQPRATFDNNSMIRLADSIRRYGILQPLSVRKTDADDSYEYELVAGERRLRAAKMLGFFTVPCVILEVDEKTSAELAIIENLLREDLNMFEQATSFRRLIDDYGLTQEDLARKMSMSQSAIANKLRLLKLTYVEQRKILEFDLSERHARALLKLNDEADRLEVISKIANEKLTVQSAEELIEKLLLAKAAGENKDKTPNKAVIPQDKELSSWLRGFKRRIDNISKSGKSATMDVKDSKNSVTVTICIKK